MKLKNKNLSKKFLIYGFGQSGITLVFDQEDAPFEGF